jgi:subtilisin-like proprotein convertase family protein
MNTTLRQLALATSLAGLTAAASAATYTSPGGLIPDGSPATPLIVTFDVTETGPLQSVDLTLTGLIHSWAGDLVVTLSAPDGTMAYIMRRPTTPDLPNSSLGDSSNFNGNYRFIDSGNDLGVALAGGGISYIVPSGSYQASTRELFVTANQPVLLNATFAGTPVFGVWTLSLSDWASSDVGALSSATLNVSAVPETSTVVLMGLGLIGIAALRRRRV